MTKPITSVPYTFGNQTTTIPLTYLDSDFTTILNFLNDLLSYSNYISDSGSANAVVLNYPSGITTTTLTTGLLLQFKAAANNSGPTTITVQVNSITIGTSTIVNTDGTALTGNEIYANGVYSILYNGTAFELVGGGGAGGASAGGAVYENTQSINANYTMATGKNGESVGPITVASGVTVTIPSGSRWVVF